jgi:porphobilinogen deaminase
VGATDGTRLIEAEARGSDPDQLGQSVAEMLLSQGAEALIRAARG